ncbi:MAG: hypothetical protein JKY17_07590 [Magnetovibrio sp.]|nr:hypothetical protein [Magnetovibrio sp.]
MPWISILLALSVLVIIVGGLITRVQGTNSKGIGWQFIRYTVIGTAMPIVALLSLNNSLSGEAVALIGSAVGFAFGKTGEKVEN